jgi:hypothetical protein
MCLYAYKSKHLVSIAFRIVYKDDRFRFGPVKSTHSPDPPFGPN